MKKFFYTALFAVFIAGCGSDAKVESNGKNNAANAPANPANASTANQTNQLAPPVGTTTNGNAGNAANGNQGLVDVTSVSRQALDNLKSKGKTGDQKAAPIPAMAATPNPAPDNSTLSTTMDAKGVPVETRIFKNHPTLLKVERTFADLANPLTKVYLKNGKVLTLPNGAVEKPEFASADEILRAVGVKQ